MMTKGKGFWFYAAAAVTITIFGFAGNRVEASGEKFYSDLIRLDRVVSKISENYVEEVDSDELVDAAISGIRTILDPHTAYFREKDYEDLKIHTAGEFGGLGITIGIRNNILTVISPLQGTPAFRMGLHAGDRIIRIDTMSTKGMSIEAAVEKLRGKPGTAVTIKVMREDMMEPVDFTIVRDIIKIESVPYADLVADSIGYVQVVQFSKKTGEDLARSINLLKKKGMKSLILDLRVNPGGLLDQAIAVGDLFLEKDQMIVFTKGRIKSQNHEFRASKPALWKGKVVVLVDRHSASASEIVAGAIQDSDRGLVLGETTFGKGSVQTILPLDAQNNALKLTTAYYYTPSGRCINKPENAVRLKHVEEENDLDSDEESVDKSKTDSIFFYTKKGRKVKANGGITPDVIHPNRRANRYTIELLRKTMFFNYAIKKKSVLEKKYKLDKALEINAEILEDFRQFVYSDTTFQQYKSAAMLAFDAFEEVLKKEATNGDTTIVAKIPPRLEKPIEELEKSLKKESEKEFENNLDIIKQSLKTELIGAAKGLDEQTAFKLNKDDQVQDAIHYLRDDKLYQNALNGKKASSR